MSGAAWPGMSQLAPPPGPTRDVGILGRDGKVRDTAPPSPPPESYHFDSGHIRRVTGLTPTTYWRRLNELRARGWIRTEKRIGGSGGTLSIIVTGIPERALIEQILRPPKRGH